MRSVTGVKIARSRDQHSGVKIVVRVQYDAMDCVAISTARFAGNWSELLVNSKCYASEESNRNKDPTTVDRDMNLVAQ